jgi:dTDP-4-amino-4,6-dideoxygalactose transaminase
MVGGVDGQHEVQEANAVPASGELGLGPRTEEIERDFAALIGVRHAVAVSSGWAGFELAFQALGLGPGDEVITSAAVPAPMAAAVHRLGARLVLVDVDAETLTLDPVEAEQKITPRTRAIVPVHFGGCPAAMDEILALAARHRLYIVEDALHALSANHQGRMIGAIGDVTVFALPTDDTLKPGDGGILTTESSDLDRLFRSWRVRSLPAPTQFRGAPESLSFQRSRLSSHGPGMSELGTELGMERVRKVQMFLGIRSYYAALYQLGLSDLGELILPEAPPGTQHAWGLYVIRLQQHQLAVTRDAVIGLLSRENVQVGVDFIPLYVHAFYREALGLRPRDYPRATDAYEQSMSLPISPKMSEADVWDVVQAVRTVLARHRRRRST